MLVQVDHLHLWGRTAHRKLFCRLVNQHRRVAFFSEYPDESENPCARCHSDRRPQRQSRTGTARRHRETLITSAGGTGLQGIYPSIAGPQAAVGLSAELVVPRWAAPSATPAITKIGALGTGMY